MSRKGFEFLDHTADEYVLAYGMNLEEAFESAALAMFEVMTDTKTVESEEVDSIKVEAEDEVALLYSWLETLLLKFEIELKLYSRFNVHEIKKTNERYSLTATIEGEAYDTKKHTARTDIKAITYYRMEVLIEENNVILKFVLDI